MLDYAQGNRIKPLLATMASTSVPYNTGGMVVVTHVYPQQGAQGSGLTQTGAAPAPSSRLQKFLKGEPSILGAVQIMIGIVIFLFGIVGAFHPTLSIYIGIPFWGATIYITAGSLTVRAYKKLGSCMVKASLGMNIISSITAGLAIILHSFDFIVPTYPYYRCRYGDYGDYDSYGCRSGHEALQARLWGTVGVMLVLSILQFILSICVSAFGCKATCTGETQPVMYITNQIPASLLTSPPSTDPLNTAEMPLLPPSVLAPAYDGNAESAEDLPPKYSLA
ncbi:membrane-spanning 4-domains subfamily A member 4A-like isoform X3 [Engraulis encrasicolus]|uniref:membrane-spanning 4-domains subfamily A member 4A-like isoform X3 n=1 Tax=Engraulis encrasicolus TaxID=184585 RepID=UPI002FD526B9